MQDFIEIPGYEEYLVHPDGRVYSTKVNRLLTHAIGSNGRPFITFSIEGNSKIISIHRLLAFVFKNLPSLDSELEVDHIDCNKLNFSLDNLNVMTKDSHRLKTTIERGHKPNVATCLVCGKKLIREQKHCKEHLPRKHPEITPEQIEYWVRKHSWVRAAKELGLTDNGLRKRYKSLTGHLLIK